MKHVILAAVVVLLAACVPSTVAADETATRKAYANYLDDVASIVDKTRDGAKLWGLLPDIEKKIRTYAKQLHYTEVPLRTVIREGRCFMHVQTPKMTTSGGATAIGDFNYFLCTKPLTRDIATLTDAQVRAIADYLAKWKDRVLLDTPIEPRP